MERLVWLAAGPVRFVLLQAALYRYFWQDNSSSEQPTAGTGARTDASRDSGTRPGEAGVDAGPNPRPEERAADRIRCRHCGTPNEGNAVYTYCWQCGQQLQ